MDNIWALLRIAARVAAEKDAKELTKDNSAALRKFEKPKPGDDLKSEIEEIFDLLDYHSYFFPDGYTPSVSGDVETEERICRTFLSPLGTGGVCASSG